MSNNVSQSLFERSWKEFKKNKGGVVGLILTLLFVFIAIFGSFIAPYDPLEVDYSRKLQPPSQKYIFGTDYMGRDLFSRLLAGAKVSLSVGFIAVGIGLSFGGILGIFAGYFDKLDNIIMRFVDVLLAFPGLLLSITIVALLGPGLQNVMIAIGISSSPSYARLIRGEILKVRENEYIEAARVVGNSNSKVIFRHILPNIISPIIVVTTFRLARAVLAASALSFLGLGAQPPNPEWGMIVNEGREYMLTAPWLILAPGGIITFAILSFNLLGDGLRDALDPRIGR